ncbi:unnamed protein product [Boreogadus saida]
MVFTSFDAFILPLEKAVKWGREIAISVPSSKGGCGDVYHMRREQRRATVLPALLHGEAVTIDMSFMLFVARERGLLTAQQQQRVLGCMRGLGLPVHHAACSLGLVRRALAGRLKHSAGSCPPHGAGQGSDETVCEAYGKWNQELSAPEDS